MRSSLSIIIVTHNTDTDTLRRCITSLSSRVHPPYELIVIDNHSEDRLEQFMGENFPGITFINNKENVGFARASNQGTNIVKGDIFLFMNPDTRIITGQSNDMIDFMNQHPNVGFLGPKIIWPDGKIQISAAEFFGLGWAFGHHLHLKYLVPIEFLRKFFSYFRAFLPKMLRSYLFVYQDIQEPREVDWLTGAFLMVRKKAFEELGGFDEDYFLYFEDQDLALRAKQKGYESYYFSSSVVEHAAGSSMEKNPRALIEKYRSELIFWIKHRSSLSLLVLRPLMAIDFSLRWIFTASGEKRDIYKTILRYIFGSKRYILTTRAL